MKQYQNLLVLLCVFSSVKAVLKVKVYYEADNVESKKFIKEQLYPTHLAVERECCSSVLSVKLIPYGGLFKQSQMEDQTWKLECKTPETIDNCAYTKIQACATNITSEWRSLNFINCLTISNGISSLNDCALKTCFQQTEMASCVNSVDGDEVLINYGIDTQALNIPLTSLPIVTFNGVYTQTEQQQAKTNLLSLVCSKLSHFPYFPEACRKPRAQRIMTHNNFGSNKYYPETIQCAHL